MIPATMDENRETFLIRLLVSNLNIWQMKRKNLM